MCPSGSSKLEARPYFRNNVTQYSSQFALAQPSLAFPTTLMVIPTIYIFTQENFIFMEYTFHPCTSPKHLDLNPHCLANLDLQISFVIFLSNI